MYWIDEYINIPQYQDYLRHFSKHVNNVPVQTFHNNILDPNYQETYIYFNNSIEDINLLKNDIYIYDNIDSAIREIKKLKFEDIIIIVSGSFFLDFIEEFNDNINDICIIPKIIVFISMYDKINKQKLENYLIQKENEQIIKENEAKMYHKPFIGKINYEFYKFGKIHDKFDEIKSFINEQKFEIKDFIDPTKNDKNNNFIFEPLKNDNQLILPIFYKILLDIADTKDNNQFPQLMCQKYKNLNIQKLLYPIINIRNIPVELLSKYFIRLYTFESLFYKEMKNSLLNDNKKEKETYMTYIKTLYSGLEKEALKTYTFKNYNSNAKLYSACYFSPNEINNIIHSFNSKQSIDYPFGILFSKGFMSFSKDKNIAEVFFKKGKNAMLIIDQTNEDYSLLTHADIEELSYSSFEKEVLFFPFSAFGVTDVINQNRIELKLTYLGKYIKDFETKKFDPSTDSLPMNSPFLNLIKESGFVKPDVVKKIENNTFNVQEVVNEYKVYKEKNAQIQKAKEIKRKEKENKSKNTNISQEEYVPGPPPKCNPCLKKALIIGAIVLVLAIIMIVIVIRKYF